MHRVSPDLLRIIRWKLLIKQREELCLVVKLPEPAMHKPVGQTDSKSLTGLQGVHVDRAWETKASCVACSTFNSTVTTLPPLKCQSHWSLTATSLTLTGLTNDNDT